MSSTPDVAAALKYAEIIIGRKCIHAGYRDRAIDLTTDAILAAARNYDPATASWPQLYGWAVNRAVNRAIAWEAKRSARLKAAAAAKAARPAAVTARPYSDEDLAPLPAPLRRVVELHLNYGFSIPETGLLCGGLTAKAVKKRLVLAAGFLRSDSPA